MAGKQAKQVSREALLKAVRGGAGHKSNWWGLSPIKASGGRRTLEGQCSAGSTVRKGGRWYLGRIENDRGGEKGKRNKGFVNDASYDDVHFGWDLHRSDRRGCREREWPSTDVPLTESPAEGRGGV